MLTLAQFNFVTLIVALAIGLAAARWVRRGAPGEQRPAEDPQPKDHPPS
jgi:hypothetical protein